MIPGFPEPLNEDGSCSHLQADNSCGIYEDRPDICNSRILYERWFIEHLSMEEYHAINAKGCVDLMNEAGITPPKVLLDAL